MTVQNQPTRRQSQGGREVQQPRFAIGLSKRQNEKP